MNKALFIDRDGIFNHLIPWGENSELCAPRDWTEFFMYPDIEGIQGVKELGYRLILVTNQPDVERGVTERTFVDEVNSFYQGRYELDAVYCCFFSDNDHPMKKPNPGMFLKAAEEFSISISQSFHLGDTDRDVEGAKRCGCKSILWDREYNRSLTADFRVSSILELKEILSKG